MLKLKKPSSIVLLLLGWLASQAAAIDHEFSSEHLNSPSSHICLAQAAHTDDLIDSHIEESVISLRITASTSQEQLLPQPGRKTYSPHSPRAPPFNS